jgi:hypothetical protein
MRKNPRRILSPQRLPFRHPGSGHSNLANTQGQRNTSEERVNQDSGRRCVAIGVFSKSESEANGESISIAEQKRRRSGRVLRRR